MPDAPWKAAERAIAARLGGSRVGPTGRDSPDVLAGELAVEVKTRQMMPRWLLAALEQATANARGRVPVVVLHQERSPHSRDLVLLSLSAFEQIVGGGGPGRGVKIATAIRQKTTRPAELGRARNAGRGMGVASGGQMAVERRQNEAQV